MSLPSPAELPPGVRIGCVRYLNSKPLIHGHANGVIFEHPSTLAARLASKDIDIGLIPTFDLLCHPEYLVVDDVAIACRGRVYSVILAHGGRLSDLRRVSLDPASRTSVNLLRVLLAEFHGLSPEYIARAPSHDAPAPGDGILLIGDQAIDFRERHHANAECHIVDLGEQWLFATGLPFVFAAWLIRPEVRFAPLVADTLRGWRDQGCGPRLEEVIAQAGKRFSAKFATFYLTQCIRYHLGAPEKRAIREFGRLLHKHRLIGAQPSEPAWV